MSEAIAEKPSNELIWVYVDVVCDLFHPGHIEFFRKARTLGDRLIVGLVSDEDTASYKPAPIMRFAERLTMVRECRLVDRVVDYPVPLHCTIEHLDAIGADFACHGDDMRPQDLQYWYADIIPSGRLRVVPYTAGVSSREIVSRVIDAYEAHRLRLKPGA